MGNIFQLHFLLNVPVCFGAIEKLCYFPDKDCTGSFFGHTWPDEGI